MDHLDVAVPRVQTADVEERVAAARVRPSRRPPRGRRRSTAGSRLTSAVGPLAMTAPTSSTMRSRAHVEHERHVVVHEQDADAGVGQAAEQRAERRPSRRDRARPPARRGAAAADRGRERPRHAHQSAPAVGQRRAGGRRRGPRCRRGRGSRRRRRAGRRAAAPPGRAAVDHQRPGLAATSRFSATVRSSNSSIDWNVRASPARARSCGGETVEPAAAERDRARGRRRSRRARRWSWSSRRRSGPMRPGDRRRPGLQRHVADGLETAERHARGPAPSSAGRSRPVSVGAGTGRSAAAPATRIARPSGAKITTTTSSTR